MMCNFTISHALAQFCLLFPLGWPWDQNEEILSFSPLTESLQIPSSIESLAPIQVRRHLSLLKTSPFRIIEKVLFNDLWFVAILSLPPSLWQNSLLWFQLKDKGNCMIISLSLLFDGHTTLKSTVTYSTFPNSCQSLLLFQLAISPEVAYSKQRKHLIN